MKKRQLNHIKNNQGFIAALDQSGGSTPKALFTYGIAEGTYGSEDEMFDLVHQMRTRIITAPAFNSDYIIGAILFEETMDRKMDGLYTADYLLEKKGISPFLKVDQGLEEAKHGVQLMKPMPGLADLLARANQRNVFGTKMRSVIHEANSDGIEKIVEQQFEVGKQIIAAGLVPIIEPEVDIHSPEKEVCEVILHAEILKHLDNLASGEEVMLKLTIPTQANLYKDLIDHPMVLRVVALSGGYSRVDANAKLKTNDGMIASFSRALTQNLNVNQSDEAFNGALKEAIQSIYDASL